MVLQFTQEQETELARIAEIEGTDAAGFAKGIILRYLDEEDRALEEGLAQADRGELIDHEEMALRIEKFLAS